MDLIKRSNEQGGETLVARGIRVLRLDVLADLSRQTRMRDGHASLPPRERSV